LHDEDPSPAAEEEVSIESRTRALIFVNLRNATLFARGSIRILLCRTIVLSEIGMAAPKSIHPVEPVRKNTRESRDHAANQVKDCIPFLEVVSWVPATQEISTTGKEAGFEDSQNETKGNEGTPDFDEPEADHRGAPKESDGWKK
jgi:hypothetical protein